MISNGLIRSLFRALTAIAMVAAFSAHADTLQDVSQLVKQGRTVPALKQLDKYLSSSPNDALARFLKGVILSETNNLGEAISIFTKLTEDHPELPEPYNNLAVIYARQQQYDKAKQALEMAIQTHPAYATAHKNLEDVYARLASQAYDRALQTDSLRGSAPVKLATIKELTSTNRVSLAALPTRRPHVEVASTDTAMGETSSPDAKLTAIASADQAVPAATTKPLEVAVAPEIAKLAEAKPLLETMGRLVTESSPVDVLPAEPAPTTKLTVANPVKPSHSSAVGDITRELTGWLAAWSDKNVEAYLAHYAKDFQTPGGEPRAAWESERTTRIRKPGAIQVTYENLQVAFDGNIATAKFRQHYKSAKLKTGTSKVLVLVNDGGRWLIQQERIGK
jgi:ketosteroid isomerase-like protein